MVILLNYKYTSSKCIALLCSVTENTESVENKGYRYHSSEYRKEFVFNREIAFSRLQGKRKSHQSLDLLKSHETLRTGRENSIKFFFLNQLRTK